MPQGASLTPGVTVIKAHRGWPRLGLGYLWERRELLRALVRRDLKVHYQQTLLGPVWLLVQPLVTTVILAAMISKVVSLPTDGAPAPLFYLSAMILWSYFSEVVLTVSHVFIYHEYLFSKAAFPRIFMPLSTVVSTLFGFAMQFVMLALLIAGLGLTGHYRPDFGALWLVGPAVALLVAQSLGLGLLVASSTVRYRDLANAVPFALQSGFLATPILYSFSMIPPQWRMVYAVLNPLSVVSDLWRAALTSTPLTASATEITACIAVTVVLLLAGLFAFQASQRTAADTI